jgi:hypothetical protein
LRLEWRSPAELADNPRNWRTHPEAQLKALAGAVAEVGWAGACLYNERTGRLIDGHARRKIAQAEGCDRVPVLVGSWTEEQEAKILATLDPLAGMAKADSVKLDALLQEVNTGCEELQQMLSDLWEDAQADALEDATPPDPVEEDTAPEPPVDPVTRPGDLWILGSHRLLCWDSTDKDRISELIGDDQPALQIIDPPFDSDYSTWELLATKVAMVWERGVDAIRWEAERLAGEEWGVYELVFTGGVRGWPCDWFPCTVHDCVRMWRSAAARKSFDANVLRASGCRTIEDGTRPFSVQEHAGGVLTGHGGMSWGKALIAMEIAMSTIDAGELVYDPCAGSGTSLIAADKHQRVWIGVENQPKWADLIVRRWEEKTGKTAQRIAAEQVAEYNAGVAGAVTPAGPKHRRSAKETERV